MPDSRYSRSTKLSVCRKNCLESAFIKKAIGTTMYYQSRRAAQRTSQLLMIHLQVYSIGFDSADSNKNMQSPVTHSYLYNAHFALCSLSLVCSLSVYLHICIRMIIYMYIHLSFCLFLSLYILTCEHIFECVRPASCLSWIRQALSHDWQ